MLVWLELVRSHGVFKYIDIIAIHAFPGMWFPDHPNWDWHSHWIGWDDKVAYITSHAEGKPVWVTETGLATWDLALKRDAKQELQLEAFNAAVAAPADRV